MLSFEGGLSIFDMAQVLGLQLNGTRVFLLGGKVRSIPGQVLFIENEPSRAER